MDSRLLPIYLNDHLAGATAGRELARRALRENRGTDYQALLGPLADEIDEDRRTLLEAMARLSIPPSKTKTAAAWTAEKLGRLKPNGQLRGYSPLSRLLELEALAGGIENKRRLWLALDRLAHEELQSTD